jgi:hypothetical protein
MSHGDKVAFLALTYGTFEKYELMRRFFNGADSGLYNLYIHNKEDLRDEYFAKYRIKDKIQDTQWGHHSLVDATLLLLKEALADPCNTRFVLISDSHLPLHSMKTTCRILQEHHGLYFSVLDQQMASHRFYKMFVMPQGSPVHIPISSKCAEFVSQWFVCDRLAAESFLEADREYGHLFDRSRITYADESWFAVMANHLKIPYTDCSFCYWNWKLASEKIMTDKGCKMYPHTFAEVTREFIDSQRDDGKLFIRKVHADTLVPSDYLLSV